MSEIPEIEEGEDVLHLSLGEDRVEAANDVVGEAAERLQETQNQVSLVVSAPAEEINPLVINQLNMAIESFKRDCDYPVFKSENKTDLKSSLEDWKQTAKKVTEDIYLWIKNLLTKAAEFLNEHFDEIRRLKDSAKAMIEAAKSRKNLAVKEENKIPVEGVLEALWHQGEKSYPGTAQVNKFYGLHCGDVSAWMQNSFHSARFNLLESVIEDLLTTESASVSDDDLWKKIGPIFSVLPQVTVRSLNQKNLAPGMSRFEQPLFYDAKSVYLEVPTARDSSAAPLLKYLKFGVMQDSAYTGRTKVQKNDKEEKNPLTMLCVLPLHEIEMTCNQMLAYLDEYKTTKDSLQNLEKLADKVRSTKYSEHNTFSRQGYILLILNRIVGGYVNLERQLRAYDARVARAVLKWCEKSLHQYV